MTCRYTCEVDYAYKLHHGKERKREVDAYLKTDSNTEGILDVLYVYRVHYFYGRFLKK